MPCSQGLPKSSLTPVLTSHMTSYGVHALYETILYHSAKHSCLHADCATFAMALQYGSTDTDDIRMHYVSSTDIDYVSSTDTDDIRMHYVASTPGRGQYRS